MRFDRIFTDQAFHPPRRRVKVIPITRARGADGIIDNSEVVGQHPILWSRPFGNGMRTCVLLMDDEDVQTMRATMSEADFAKLPEVEIDW